MQCVKGYWTVEVPIVGPLRARGEEKIGSNSEDRGKAKLRRKALRKGRNEKWMVKRIWWRRMTENGRLRTNRKIKHKRNDKEKERGKTVRPVGHRTGATRQRVGVTWGDTEEREQRQEMKIQPQNNKYKHNPRWKEERKDKTKSSYSGWATTSLPP